MAKRKSRRAAMKPQKKHIKLDTIFKCPFCCYPSSVDCSIDLKNHFGEVKCWVCQESYATEATHLTEPVDIYHEWIDECEKINNEERNNYIPKKKILH